MQLRSHSEGAGAGSHRGLPAIEGVGHHDRVGHSRLFQRFNDVLRHTKRSVISLLNLSFVSQRSMHRASTLDATTKLQNILHGIKDQQNSHDGVTLRSARMSCQQNLQMASRSACGTFFGASLKLRPGAIRGFAHSPSSTYSPGAATKAAILERGLWATALAIM